MPVYADYSIPCNLSKTAKEGFSAVVSVEPCATAHRIHDGVCVREMTHEEMVQYGAYQVIPHAPKELRAAAYEAICDPIMRSIEAYELEYSLRPDRLYLAARITMLRNEWDAQRELIREQYPDEAQ